MSRHAWFGGGGLPRTAMEAGLLAFALILPLAAVLWPALSRAIAQSGAPEGGRSVLGLGMAYTGYFAALLGAVRLRRGNSPARRVLVHELAGTLAILTAVWVGALLAHLAGAAWAGAGGSPDGARELVFASRPTDLAGISAVGTALVYPFFRGVVLVWPLWQRLRRRRLLWALTHAQFVAALVLAAGVAAFSMAYLGAQSPGELLGPEDLPADAGVAAVALAWLTARFFPVLTEFLVLGIIASAALLPPAALVSYLVLRRTTRRLEQLAAAAGALRAGDLSARVQTGGEDEVGSLQADFNAMAADLERTLRDLESERDRVGGLLESRRQLVAVVSHELRTPVATVRGYIESALRRAGSPPEALRSDLEAMERETARLHRLIEDLFTLSRAEVGRLELRLEPTDVGQVVGRLVATLAPLAWQRHRVQVLVEALSGLPPARADADRLDQIAGNLVGNAVRHTPPGGLVVVALSAEPDAVRVEVRDTGEGIAPEDLPRIFDRFYRGAKTSLDADGAGLGLALVKELAEAMGGSVEAASTPGEGSTFTVRLPRA